MKPGKSKQEIRHELNQQIQDFLERGGNVTQVERGVSGNIENNNLFRMSAQIEPRADRTPLTDVVQTLEERKHNKNKHAKTAKRPRKKLIVDDFGDPIRWVWEE